MRDFSRRDFLRQTTVTLAMAALAARATPGQAASTTTVDATAFIDASGEGLILGGRPLSWWIEAFGLPFHVSYARRFRHGSGRIAPQGMESELFTARYPKEKMLEALLTNDITVNGRTMKATAALEVAATPALMVEPGRSIVSDSGITLARVAFDKKIAGVHGLISLDLGVVNYCQAIVALPARKWALATLPQRRDPAPFETFIAGNLCFSADMLSRLKVAFPRRPLRGDVLLISSTGAYTIRPSSPPTPTPSRGPRALSTRRTAIGPI
jgi:hypothetical protein